MEVSWKIEVADERVDEGIMRGWRRVKMEDREARCKREEGSGVGQKVEKKQPR